MSAAPNAASSPVSLPRSLFDDPAIRYARVDRPADEPAPERGVLDVAVLDMNHGWANLGHASIVETLLTLGRLERMNAGGRAPAFRVISYNLRGGGAVPVSSPSRFPLVIGTGGPGSLDPRANDGVSFSSQGILENPSWETPLWRFFDAILGEPRTSLLGICHSFGLLARWSGAARPVLRPIEKGGKSTGVVANVLTPAAQRHPWFSGLYEAAGGPTIEVLDSRLFDLVPDGRNTFLTLAHEANGLGGPGEAVTMLEFARDDEGLLPRVWGVNYHPEIGDRGLQRERLHRLEMRGEVSPEWVTERRAALEAWNTSAATEKHLQATAAYTFDRPLRRVIARALAEYDGVRS